MYSRAKPSNDIKLSDSDLRALRIAAANMRSAHEEALNYSSLLKSANMYNSNSICAAVTIITGYHKSLQDLSMYAPVHRGFAPRHMNMINQIRTAFSADLARLTNDFTITPTDNPSEKPENSGYIEAVRCSVVSKLASAATALNQFLDMTRNLETRASTDQRVERS